jgi:hypothetical protein
MQSIANHEFDISYPPDNDDKKKQLGDFFGTYPPPKVAGQVPDYVKAVKDQDSSIEKFGIIGVSAVWFAAMFQY